MSNMLFSIGKQDYFINMFSLSIIWFIYEYVQFINNIIPLLICSVNQYGIREKWIIYNHSAPETTTYVYIGWHFVSRNRYERGCPPWIEMSPTSPKNLRVPHLTQIQFLKKSKIMITLPCMYAWNCIMVRHSFLICSDYINT